MPMSRYGTFKAASHKLAPSAVMMASSRKTGMYSKLTVIPTCIDHHHQQDDEGNHEINNAGERVRQRRMMRGK